MTSASWKKAKVVVTAASVAKKKPLPTKSSWTVRTEARRGDYDQDEKVSVSIIDYSPHDLKTTGGAVDPKTFVSGSTVDPLLNGLRPDWAVVRWTNLDCNLAHPGHVLIVKHVLEAQLPDAHAAGLALESITASGQRARFQFFGGVFFLLAKIPQVPPNIT